MSFNKSKLYLLVSISALLLSACSETNEQGTDFAHLERAAAYQDRGQYKAATIEYKNAVKKSGADASAAVQYADMMNHLGHYSEALNLLDNLDIQNRERLQSTLSYDDDTVGGLMDYDIVSVLKDYNIKDILIIDDATYSGTQLNDNIEDLYSLMRKVKGAFDPHNNFHEQNFLSFLNLIVARLAFGK